MTRRPRAAALVLLLVVVVIGAVAAVPAGAASDRKLAKTGLIVAKDLPRSWESAPADPDSGDAIEQLAAGYPECVDYLDSRQQLDEAANADSRQFSSAEGDDLSNETWVFATTRAARSAFEAMAAPSNASCLTLLFQAAFEQQIADDPETAAQVSGVSALINPTSSVPSNGDDQLGFVGTVDLTLTDGSTERLLVAYFAIRTGRGIAGYTITASAVDGVFRDSFVEPAEGAIDASATRLEKALEK